MSFIAIMDGHLVDAEVSDPQSGASEAVHSSDVLAAWIDSVTVPEITRPVIHLHGGLVPIQHARKIAETLASTYEGHAPLFIGWHSGLLEQLDINLHEYAHDPGFQRFVIHVARFLIGKGRRAGIAHLSEGENSPSLPDDAELEKSLQKPDPLSEYEGDYQQAAQTSATISLSDAWDPQAIDVRLSEVELAAINTAFASDSALAQPGAVSQRLGSRLELGAWSGGVAVWAQLAASAYRVVKRVLRRRAANRDHGLHATIVEEFLRELDLDGITQGIWAGLKKDAFDAVHVDPKDPENDGAYVTLLRGLAQHPNPKDLTPLIVAHSAGAIHAVELIRAAADMSQLDGMKFDLVLLAPACTTGMLSTVLNNSRYRARLGSMRLFGMQDEIERQDYLIPASVIKMLEPWTLGAAKALQFVYPHSLLYFVSGVCEDEPDMPLVGLQRHHAPTYHASNSAVTSYFSADPSRCVWSVTDDHVPEGLASTSRRHGDFDNDPLTLESLKFIVQTPLSVPSEQPLMHTLAQALKLEADDGTEAPPNFHALTRTVLMEGGLSDTEADDLLAAPGRQELEAYERVTDAHAPSQLRELLTLISSDPEIPVRKADRTSALVRLTSAEETLVKRQFPGLLLSPTSTFRLSNLDVHVVNHENVAVPGAEITVTPDLSMPESEAKGTTDQNGYASVLMNGTQAARVVVRPPHSYYPAFRDRVSGPEVTIQVEALFNAGTVRYDWGHTFMNHSNPPPPSKYFGMNVKVAVIDSGVDHPSLEPLIVRGQCFVDGYAIGDYRDTLGHGTHVAGIIAATNPEGSKDLTVGHAPLITLYVARVSIDGHVHDTDLVRAINWAIDQKVDLINLSLGGVIMNPTLEDVLDRAYRNGILIVAAAGNHAGAVEYPAAHKSVVAVTALGRASTEVNQATYPPGSAHELEKDTCNRQGVFIAKFSNRGPQIRYAAPGVAVTSTLPGGRLGVKSGTSMAAPHVTGVAAVLLSRSPELQAVTGPKRVVGLLKALDGRVVKHGLGSDNEGLGVPYI